MKTVVLFELHHLGDAVLSLPFVRAHQNASERILHVVCRRGSAEIFHKFLPDKQIHCWEPWWELRGAEKFASLRKLLELETTLRALQPDEACCVWADSRVHGLMRRAGAQKTIGFPVNKQNFYAHERPWRRRRMRLGQIIGWFAPLSHPLQRNDYQQSHLADWQQLTEAAGLSWDAATPWFDVPGHALAETWRPPAKKLWLIHPGGRLATKRWPLTRFQELLDTTLLDSPVILIEPPDSPALLARSPLHHSVSTAHLSELLSFIQSADTILCNDSLVSHLAAALGKPVWTIFGSGNPNWFAPSGSESRVIASDVCRFRPCIDRCVYPSPICLEAVTVADVASRLAEA